MSVPTDLDHVVVAGPDLAAAIDLVERRTGVRAAPGGRHPGLGTANALIAFTRLGERVPQYLEIIGPDPDAAPDAPPPTAFGIAGVPEPRVVAYAVHPDDIERRAATARARTPFDPGPVEDLSRRTADGDLLEWRLTMQRPEVPAHLPFLIDWGASAHPGETTVPTLELLGFEADVPDVRAASDEASAFGSDIGLRRGDEPALRLTVEGPHGPVVLT